MTGVQTCALPIYKSKAISAPKLSDLGANFAKEMNKKNLLSKDEGKGGPMEVSFADGTEFRMKGVVRIDGGDSSIVTTAAGIRGRSNA